MFGFGGFYQTKRKPFDPGALQKSLQGQKKGLFRRLLGFAGGLGFHGLFAGLDFVEGLDAAKEGFQMGLKKTAGRSVLKQILSGMGLATLGAGLAFEVGRYLHKRHVLHSAQNRAKEVFEQVVASDPHLQQYPRQELEQYLQTLLQIAPNVASDPVLLRQALKQIVTYGGIDPQSAKLLSELDQQILQRKVLSSIEAGEVSKALHGTAGLLQGYSGLLGG